MFLDKIFGSRHDKIIKEIKPIVETIGSFEAGLGKAE